MFFSALVGIIWMNGLTHCLLFRHPCFLLLTLMVSYGTAVAAPPIAYDNWSIDGQTITAPCPDKVSCRVYVDDVGILERQLNFDNGLQYIQLILSDQGMQSESFTRIGNNYNILNAYESGIASKQTINSASVSGVDKLINTTMINTGWADNADEPDIDISQIIETTYNGMGYQSSFNYSADNDATGEKVGTKVSISQRLTDTLAIIGEKATGLDVQQFEFRRASGVSVPKADSLNLPGVSGGTSGIFGDGMVGNGAGGDVSWQAGNDIQIVWIGQLCEGCPQAYNPDAADGRGDSTFNYQIFDNLTDEFDPIATGAIDSTSPVAWPASAFGAAPSL